MFLFVCFLNECWLYDFFTGFVLFFSTWTLFAECWCKGTDKKRAAEAHFHRRPVFASFMFCSALLRASPASFFLIFSEFLRVFCEFLVLKSQQLQYSEHCFTICFFLNRAGMTGRVGCNEWTSWRRQRNVLTRTRVHPRQDDGLCWTKQRNVLPESTGHPRPDKGLRWPSGGTENGKWFILPRFPCGR